VGELIIISLKPGDGCYIQWYDFDSEAVMNTEDGYSFWLHLVTFIQHLLDIGLKTRGSFKQDILISVLVLPHFNRLKT